MSCKCKEKDIGVLKVKLNHPDAKVPDQAHPNSDAGYDLVAINDGIDVFTDSGDYLFTEYDTGISVEPPDGYHTEIVARSSITKKNLILKNSIGIIDNGYRGSCLCRFHKTGDIDTTNVYKKGDKIAQLIIRKTIHMPLMVVDTLSDTERGVGGFGHSDQKKV